MSTAKDIACHPSRPLILVSSITQKNCKLFTGIKLIIIVLSHLE